MAKASKKKSSSHDESGIPRLLGSSEKPSVTSSRDTLAYDLGLTFKPLYEQLSLSAGKNGLDHFIKTSSLEEKYQIALSFVRCKDEHPKVKPLNGAREEYENKRARTLLLTWICHRTESGGFTNWKNSLENTHKAGLSKDELLAIYAAETWHACRGVSYDWNSVQLSIHKGLEGSIRYHNGKRFENRIRKATEVLITDLNLPFEVLPDEARIDILDAKGSPTGNFVKLDIVVKYKGSNPEFLGRKTVIPCKSSQINSSNHADLFSRDVLASLIHAGIQSGDVIVAFGGQGWKGQIEKSPFKTILVEDFSDLEPDPENPWQDGTPFASLLHELHECLPQWMLSLAGTH